MKKKTVVCTVVAAVMVLLCGALAPRVFAATDYRAPLQEQIELPADLNFSVSDTCSGHTCFEQAAANAAVKAGTKYLAKAIGNTLAESTLDAFVSVGISKLSDLYIVAIG